MRSLFCRWAAPSCFLIAMIANLGGARADVLFDQPPTVQDGFYYTWTSAFTDSNFNYFYTLDNFQLSADSTVTDISWQGMYLQYDSSSGTYTNGDPNTENWFIGLLTSGGDANFPFEYVTYQTIGAGDVTETFAGTTIFDGGTVNYYNETVHLPTGISLQGNQTYYLAIFSENSGSTDSWSWLSGYGADGGSYQYSTYSNSTVDVQLDRRFQLVGQAVPEPSSLALAALGLVGVGWRRANRRRGGKSFQLNSMARFH